MRRKILVRATSITATATNLSKKVQITQKVANSAQAKAAKVTIQKKNHFLAMAKKMNRKNT